MFGIGERKLRHAKSEPHVFDNNYFPTDVAETVSLGNGTNLLVTNSAFNNQVFGYCELGASSSVEEGFKRMLSEATRTGLNQVAVINGYLAIAARFDSVEEVKSRFNKRHKPADLKEAITDFYRDQGAKIADSAKPAAGAGSWEERTGGERTGRGKQ